MPKVNVSAARRAMRPDQRSLGETPDSGNCEQMLFLFSGPPSRYAAKMPLQPEDWNVVILGRWNTALFTPASISRRIFHLSETTPVEVFVVLDDIQMPRVKHDGITIAPSTGQVLISPEQCTFSQLDRARVIAHDAIEELPKTPLLAGGYNLRYRADEMPASLTKRFSEDLDRRFSDQDFQILGRQFHRILGFQAGRLLVRVTRDPDGRAEVLLNFDLQSKEQKQLQDWFAVPLSDVRNAAERVLEKALELQKDDYVIEHNEYTGRGSNIEATAGRD